MKLQALRDNLVLKPILASGVSAGGVVLPGAKQIEDGCIVISTGPMVADLAVNDIVVRPDPPRYIIVDDDTGEELWLSAEEDVLAKVVNDKEE